MRRAATSRARWLLLAGLALAGLEALAAPKPRVVVMAEEQDGALARRLRAEFLALSFDVVVTPARGVSARVLQEAAQVHDAVAAVSVGASNRGLEVWVADRLTGKVVLSEVLTPSDASVSVEGLMATRAVELLRASMLELEHRPQGAPAEAAGVTERLRSREPSARGWWLQPSAGGGVVAARGLAPTPGVWLGLRWQPARHLAVEATGALALGSTQVREAEGTARLSPWLVGVGALVGWPQRGDDRWGVGLLGGAFAVLLQYEGVAARPELLGRRGTLTTVAPYLGVEGSVRVWARVALRLRGAGGYALAPLVIRFDGREVSTSGPWLGAASLALSVDL